EQSIRRAIVKKGGAIYIPERVYLDIRRMVAISRRFEIDNGETPSDEYLAEEMGISVDDVMYLKDAQTKDSLASLDRSVGDDGDTLGDLLPNSTEDVADVVADTSLKWFLDEFLNMLTERERTVIEMRYGWVDDKVHAYEEIGAVFGLSIERVRQV